MATSAQADRAGRVAAQSPNSLLRPATPVRSPSKRKRTDSISTLMESPQNAEIDMLAAANTSLQDVLQGSTTIYADVVPTSSFYTHSMKSADQPLPPSTPRKHPDTTTDSPSNVALPQSLDSGLETPPLPGARSPRSAVAKQLEGLQLNSLLGAAGSSTPQPQQKKRRKAKERQNGWEDDINMSSDSEDDEVDGAVKPPMASGPGHQTQSYGGRYEGGADPTTPRKLEKSKVRIVDEVDVGNIGRSVRTEIPETPHANNFTSTHSQHRGISRDSSSEPFLMMDKGSSSASPSPRSSTSPSPPPSSGSSILNSHQHSTTGKASTTAFTFTPTPTSPSLKPLVWLPSEITGHLGLDPDDDGYGINGVGFKPTAAMARERARKRRLQVEGWRKREEAEGRRRRAEGRGKVAIAIAGLGGGGKEGEQVRQARSVRFA